MRCACCAALCSVVPRCAALHTCCCNKLARLLRPLLGGPQARCAGWPCALHARDAVTQTRRRAGCPCRAGAARRGAGPVRLWLPPHPHGRRAANAVRRPGGRRGGGGLAGDERWHAWTPLVAVPTAPACADAWGGRSTGQGHPLAPAGSPTAGGTRARWPASLPACLQVAVAGRVLSRRFMGKLAFFKLVDASGSIQVRAAQPCLGVGQRAAGRERRR